MRKKWWRNERGEAPSILLFGMVPIILMVIGLYIDGGGVINAQEQATLVAQSAARAGVNGGTTADTTLSPSLAREAAQKYLAKSEVEGSVAVQGQTVTVRAVVTYYPEFLPIGPKQGIGIGEARAFRPGQ